jgi:hypothetical protein
MIAAHLSSFLALRLLYLVFYGLLNLFNSGPVKALGFADDSGLVTTGPDPQLLCKFRIARGPKFLFCIQARSIRKCLGFKILLEM